MTKQADEREVAQIHTTNKWGVRIQTQSVASTGSELLLAQGFQGQPQRQAPGSFLPEAGAAAPVGFPRGLLSLQLSPS